MIKPVSRLNDEQITFFLEYGYLALDEITTAEEIERIRMIYDRLFEEDSDSDGRLELAGLDDDGQSRLPQLMHPSHHAAELVDTLYRRHAATITRQLLGDVAVFIEDHAIRKPAGHGALTPWHQDEAYWYPAYAYERLSVWMPIQETDERNGCMHFIPATHRQSIQLHQPIENDPRNHGLEVTIEESRAISCPLPPGGPTFHHCRTMHYTSPNHSEEPRRAYILNFGIPPRPLDQPRRFPWREQRNKHT